MVAARRLFDPVPGNIGLLLDPNTVILLPFTELTGVRPTDIAGTLEDIEGGDAYAGGDQPWTSPVLWGDGATAMSAVDKADRSSLLTRDVTVQAIMHAGDTFYTAPLIARGSGTGPDYRAFMIEFDCADTTTLNIRWSWQDLAGVVRADAWQSVTAAGVPLDGPFLLTCTRRWVSSTSVVLRYYVDDRLLAETTSTYGEIGGSTTGVTTIAGDASVTLNCRIDQLKVTNHEMSHEEIRATWRRFTEHQPNGVLTLRASAPPGAPFLRPGPDSDIGRLLKAAGQAVGFAAAKAHELLATHLPSTAYADTLARWERLVGLATNDRTALDTRRTRVVSLLERDNGYSPAKVQTILATPFDLDAADVEIVEFSPTIEDNFATLEDERWLAEPSAAWSIVSNELQLSRSAGDDIRFDPTASMSPCHMRMSVDDDDGLIVQVKLSTYWAALPASSMVGLYLYNRRTNDSLWFGIKNDAGTRKVGWVQLKAGVQSAFTTIINPSTDAAYYLRIKRNTAEGSYNLKWSTTGFEAGGPTVDITSSIEDVEWVGVGALSTAATIGGTLTATFDDFLVRIPNGERGFRWFAYRDTGIAGDPDMFAAQGIVRTVKPAHTEACAITSLSLLCDNTGSACDRGPMGGI